MWGVGDPMGFRGCFRRDSGGTDLNTLCSGEYGDPMGFALDPLDPLERGVALDLVVALDPVVYFSHNQHLSKVYKGYVLTPKYDDGNPNYGR